jgi:hypothetical protein
MMCSCWLDPPTEEREEPSPSRGREAVEPPRTGVEEE